MWPCWPWLVGDAIGFNDVPVQGGFRDAQSRIVNSGPEVSAELLDLGVRNVVEGGRRSGIWRWWSRVRIGVGAGQGQDQGDAQNETAYGGCDGGNGDGARLSEAVHVGSLAAVAGGRAGFRSPWSRAACCGVESCIGVPSSLDQVRGAPSLSEMAHPSHHPARVPPRFSTLFQGTSE